MRRLLIMKVSSLVVIALCLLLTGTSTTAIVAAEQPLELQWSHLMPPAPPKLRSFLAPKGGPFDIGSVPSGDVTAQEYRPEGRWMSTPSTSRGPAPVVESLDGKRVRIGGYVVPLDFEATSVKEFLLVPFVGACIHVPPPPANQIIYVKSDEGFGVKGSFDPVYVTGTLKVMATSTGLADTGYSIVAEKVEVR
jgi:uncharacterized protein